MRKLISLLLALVMIMSLATVAFAEDAAAPTHADESTVTVTKVYTATNENTTSPAETFKFSELTCTEVTDAADGVTTGNAPVPTINSVAYAKGEATAVGTEKNFTITLPEYTSVGIYTYTFNEIDGETAGVTYRSENITLVVTVIQGEDGKIRVATVHTEAEGNKSDKFNNVYSAGSLAVKKTVTGILGDQSKDFTVKVTFTTPEGKTVREDISYIDGTEKTIEAGWTGTKEVELVLKHDETVTFTNIPYGVNYTVDEIDYTSEGYNVTYDDNKDGTIEAAAVSTEIINNKEGNVDTGITLDSIPFVVMMVVCAAAAVLFIIKRRNSVEF